MRVQRRGLRPCQVGMLHDYMGVSKIRGTILGVPIIRAIVYWGLYWGTLIWGNYHMGTVYCQCSRRMVG